jgi:hypothetical protein
MLKQGITIPHIAVNKQQLRGQENFATWSHQRTLEDIP